MPGHEPDEQRRPSEQPSEQPSQQPGQQLGEMPGEMPGETVVRLGAVLVAIGCVATVVTLIPLFLDADPLPAGFYLLCFLAPVGLGLILVGLWRSARARGRRLRAASDAQGPHTE